MSYAFYLGDDERRDVKRAYCAYSAIAAAEMKELPTSAVSHYIDALRSARAVYPTDGERLARARALLDSRDSSVSEMGEALELIANVEFDRLFCRDAQISQETRALMREHRHKEGL